MHNNKHVIGLSEIKQFWVPAYLRDHFFGGMTTIGRPECINAFMKRFIGSHSNLSQLVKQADLAIEDVQQRELHDTMLEKYRGSALRTMSPMEEQARGVLTPFCFKKFQEEFGRATLYLLVGKNGHEFILKYHEETTTKKRIVFWDGEQQHVVASTSTFGEYFVVTFLVCFFIRIAMQYRSRIYQHVGVVNCHKVRNHHKC
ncbi:hypothetical protein RHMOL_Rhmol10G0206800 [Rhododendron molle]|uniref:Uncharacterized protein n=1 Tax=Rhododendron molle TaxID=49168 RepID=A0ACC0M620_RHOML|nr:hypothetical protein RHMOL_Rhmol10G0206800 [Rhododendron molle]